MGAVPSGILAYGEAPGAKEEQDGLPFQGNAGGLLDEILGMAGMTRSDLYIGNVARCRPPGNRNPSTDELEACRLYTSRELEAVQPKVIVSLGGVPLKALTGKTAIGENRGKLLPLLPAYRSNVRVIPSYHPASILHQPSIRAVRMQQIADDLKLAKKFTTGGVWDATIVINPAKVPKALDLLQRCDRLACDLEWEVFPGRKTTWPWSRQDGGAPRLVSYGLAGRVDGRLLACSFDAADTPDLVKEMLARIPTIYHNAVADVIWLLSRGIHPIIAGDTWIRAFLLNIQSSLSLKALAPTLTSVPAGWGDEMGDLLGKVPETPEEWQQTKEYNAKDAVATFLLDEELETRSEGKPFMPLYREVLLPAALRLSEASLAGVPFDTKRLHELAEAAKGRIETLTARIRDTVGSSRQSDIAHAVERVAGIMLPRTEKTQQPSIAEEALLPYRDRHPLVKDILTAGKLKKLDGTYLRPWGQSLAEQGDHRLHTLYRLAGPRTGRTAAEQEQGGTVQQYPRWQPLRECVKVPDGWKLISADQSMIEMRIAAWIAQDQQLLAFFQEGRDVHVCTASWIRALAAGCSLAEWKRDMDAWMAKVTAADRYAAKAPNFGFLFGLREEGFIKQALKKYGITFTMDTAAQARAGYFELYADLLSWHEDSWKWVHLGYVDTATGRRRMLGGEDENALHRKAINTPIQGPASDLSIAGGVKACQRLEDEGLLGDSVLYLGFIHDDNLFMAKDAAVPGAVEIIEHEMEHPGLDRIGMGDFDVPLVVKAKVGQTWS
jgi:DNA polymerase